VEAQIGTTFEPFESRSPALSGRLRDLDLPLSYQSFQLLQGWVRRQPRHSRWHLQPGHRSGSAAAPHPRLARLQPSRLGRPRTTPQHVIARWAAPAWKAAPGSCPTSTHAGRKPGVRRL